MTDVEADIFIRRVYWLAGSFGFAGSLGYVAVGDPRSAAAFGFGAIFSLGTLWLYERMVRALEPGPQNRKPWQAGAFVARYLLLLIGGYAIVKVLGVNALAVILGLLAGSAAVLTATLVEVLLSFFVKRS